MRAVDKSTLAAWYRTRLGIPVTDDGWAVLSWRERDDPARVGETVWSLFPSDTEYLGPASAQFMVNYRVDDLEAFLERLRDDGVTVDDKRYQDENGRFAWITDPEGHRIELWEPAPGH